MKSVNKIFLLLSINIYLLFSQIIEINELYSLSSDGLNFQRAYMNSDNSIIAAEQIVSPLQVYFFSIDDSFKIAHPLSRKRILPGKKNKYKAFQFRWSPINPEQFYYCLINPENNNIEFWSGEMSYQRDVLHSHQHNHINNNSQYASVFYPDQFPSMKIISIDDGFSENDIWFLGVRDTYQDYYLYSSDERFAARDNRLFLNTEYDPIYFDIHYDPDNVSVSNDGYKYVLCIQSNRDLDIVYFNNSNQLTKKYWSIKCPCHSIDKVALTTTIDSKITCDTGHHTYTWPEDEKYIYIRDTFTYEKEQNTYVPIGQQFQPQFNHTGNKIAFINGEAESSGDINFKLVTFDIPNQPEYGFPFSDGKETDQIDNLQVFYNIIDENILTNDAMDIAHWSGVDFSWHPQKNILFYVKKETVKNVVRYYLMYHDLDNNEIGQLKTGTLNNAMPTISNNGEFLLFHHQGKEDIGDYHFDNCPNNNMGQKNTNCCYSSSANSNYKIGAARLQY